MIIGSHVQMKAPDYVLGSVREALSYEANALMLYTGAPQNTRRTPVEQMKINEAQELMKQSGINPEHLIIHAPYIINPANSVKPEVAELAREFLAKEIERTAAIGAKYLVLHPGSFTTTDLQTGIGTIIETLNTIE
ncbi:MAG: deoxyribonuclease IV, partial [Solobacterium sp.]|nr:deoxyribonuclease IV [Solobacterium sp.]